MVTVGGGGEERGPSARAENTDMNRIENHESN